MAKLPMFRQDPNDSEGGFTQGDLLDTLFSNGEVSQRLRDMVYAAVDAAGNEAMLNIVAAMQERCDG